MTSCTIRLTFPVWVFLPVLLVLRMHLPADAQPLPFLDDVTTKGLSPYGYRLDSYRWNQQDGLPDRNLYALLQDRNGLMWMSAKSGLFTFDGHTLRTLDVVNRSLENRIICRLAEDLHGNIWLVKYQPGAYEVDVLNPRTLEVVPLHQHIGVEDPIHIPESGDQFILYNMHGQIWLGIDAIGFHYDGAWSTSFRKQDGIPYGIWRPAEEGVWQLDQQAVVRLLDHTGVVTDSFSLENGRLMTSWTEADLSLWLGYSRQGTAVDHYIQLSSQGNKIVHRQSEVPPVSAWHNDFINSGMGKGTGYWLYPSLVQGDLFLGFHSEPTLFNLSDLFPFLGTLNPLYFDREGGVWTTTDDGIIRLVLRPNLPFRRILQGEMPAHSTRGIALFQDKILVNSYLGAQLLDPATGRSSPFEYPNNHLGLALLVEDRYVWIGEHRNPLLLVKDQGEPLWFPFDKQPDLVTALHRTRSGDLLAGTDRGLYRLHPTTGRLERRAVLDGMVACFHQNDKGLWIGTSQGLFLLDEHGNARSRAFAPAPGQPFGYITHIHEDEAGIFWMATHCGGLVRLNPANGESVRFTVENGLSNNLVHAVYPDRSGNLWLPSDFGLMRFHKNSGRVQTFFEADGLADSEFNLLSHVRTPDGQLLLGGVDGITAFFPDSIPPEQQQDGRLHLIDARNFNLRSGLYASQSVDLTDDKELVLHPSDAYLDLSVSGLRYDRSDRYRFAWKIDGVQDNWVEQTTPTIRLSNLPYGRHHLLVRFSRQGNQWTQNTLDIPVRMLRPFYLDWPFLLLLLVAMAGIAWLFTSWRTRRLSDANLLLEQEVAQRTRQIEADRTLIARQANELRSLDELKSRFFANVTHELRSPLTLILGPLDRLLQSFQPDHPTAENLRVIRRNALRLLNLVEELLELSRMESGNLRLEQKPVDFKAFLTRLSTAFLPFAEHRGIRLSLQYACRHDRPILLDARKWEKIVNNLLGNALKFTPRGGSITLSVSCETADTMVLQVADSGQGIHPDDLPFVFDRFYQGKTRHTTWQGGTGIGLSLCREYARLFGGELTARSTLGHGSVFRLSFPFMPADGFPVTPLLPELLPQEEAFPGNLASTNHRHTVLVVEDDPDMLAYIHGCLQQDYHLLLADNGRSALEILEKHPVDLVLSDLMMPEMDGLQLLETVRRTYADLPFVLLTARVDTKDRLSALHLGVDDYLTKPFLDAELLARLRNMIARYEARRAIRLDPPATPDHAPPEPASENPGALPFDRKWLAELEALVRANLQDNRFSIPLMAQGMNITERTLQYKLKSFTGMTPNQYLTEARLKEARFLLENQTYATVAEVCYAVGFKTTQYFSRLMKERFGKSPADYLSRE